MIEVKNVIFLRRIQCDGLAFSLEFSKKVHNIENISVEMCRPALCRVHCNAYICPIHDRSTGQLT